MDLNIETEEERRPAPNFDIEQKNGIFSITSPYVDLSSDRKPLEFKVTLEKQPTPVYSGAVYQEIAIDYNSPKYQKMLEEAAKLKAIPERERPRKLVKILRSQVQYPYSEVVKTLEVDNPELAARVKAIQNVRGVAESPLPLSEIIETGYGECRHLSVALLPLAQAAGMEAALLASRPQVIKNVIRSDNGQKLFKLYKVDEKATSHVWVEMRSSTGEWIPADPATQLIGDTLEGIETFRDAGYRSIVSVGTKGLLGDVTLPPLHEFDDLEFYPGENNHTGVVEINANSPQTFFDEPQEITKYTGPLSFQFYPCISPGALTVSILDIQGVV